MPPIKPNPESAKRKEEKAQRILAVLNTPEIDLWKLRGLAITDGGLINDDLRRKAWPKLVGLHDRYWDDENEALSSRSDTRDARHTSDGSTVNTDATPKKSNVHRTLEDFVDNQSNGTQSSLRARTTSEASTERSHSPESDGSSSMTSTNSLRDKVLASSLDFHQIELDVARCTWHLLTGTQRLQRLQMEYKRNRKVARLIRRKQRRLANLINLTLVKSYKRLRPFSNESSPTFDRDNTLRYYQGYHDVACIVLSALSGNTPLGMSLQNVSPSSTLDRITRATGLDRSSSVLLQLSQSHFRDCMRANFAQLQTTMRLTLFPLIAYFDLTLHDFLADCSMEPFFALSWIITWFSHDVRDTDLTKRLFDFFLSSHPLMPLYVSVAMVCHPLNRQDVLQTECDFASVHQTLSALPRNSSMVGWKYQPGDGYISDDEQSVNDDESFASQNSVDTEFILHEEVIKTVHEHDKLIGAEAVSTVSSSMSTCYDARVPFQEILDLALVYMERLPPRNLLRLARRYYGKELVESLSKQAPGIFVTPPYWTMSPTAKSDQELRRQENLLATGNNKLEFHRSYHSTIDPFHHPASFHDPLIHIAVVAAGISSRDDEDRKKKRARLLLLIGAVAVVVVAFGWKSLVTIQQPVGPCLDVVRNWTSATPDEINNGQTILAASTCWETTESDFLEQDYFLAKSSYRKATSSEPVQIMLTTSDDTSGLRRLDNIDGELLLDHILKFGTRFFSRETIEVMIIRSQDLSMHARYFIDIVVERLQTMGAFWVKFLSNLHVRFLEDKKQPMLPGAVVSNRDEATPTSKPKALRKAIGFITRWRREKLSMT